MSKSEFRTLSFYVILISLCGLAGVYFTAVYSMPGICIFFTFAVSSVSLLMLGMYALITKGERK